MNNEAIRQAIMGRVVAVSWGSLTAPAMATPNRAFTPPTDAAWIRPVIKIGAADGVEKGAAGIGIKTGALMVSVFVPADKGNSLALKYADSIEAAFRRADAGGVWFGEPYTVEVGNDPEHNNFYQVSVQTPFSALVGE